MGERPCRPRAASRQGSGEWGLCQNVVDPEPSHLSLYSCSRAHKKGRCSRNARYHSVPSDLASSPQHTLSHLCEAARRYTVVMLVPLLSCLQPHVLNSLSRTGEGCSPEGLGTAADTRSFRVWLFILSEGKTTQSQTNALVKYVLSESDLRCSCCTHTKW